MQEVQEEKQQSSASLTEPQTQERLHSTRYGQTYNGVINDPQFPLHIDIGNTN